MHRYYEVASTMPIGEKNKGFEAIVQVKIYFLLPDCFSRNRIQSKIKEIQLEKKEK